MTGPAPAPPGRIGRAAHSFGVPPERVPDAACGFAGRATATGPAGRGLLDRLVARIEQVPLGTLITVADLSDAAACGDPGPHRLVPPVPEPIVDVVAFVDVLLAGLRPDQLRTAAGDVALDRATVRHAAVQLAPSPATDLFTDDLEDYEGLAQRHIAVLRGVDPDRWGRAATAVLRRALRLYLAEIGDAVLRASEWQSGPALAWQPRADGALVATCPVPGAPTPLLARLGPHPGGVGGEDAGAVFGTRSPWVGLPHCWEVGWGEDDERFGRYGGRSEASLPAARFAAEVTLAGLVADPARVRMPWTGALLVPRPAGTRNIDGHVVDLADVLVAVMNQHRGERGDRDPGGWAMRPHTLGDGGLGSVVAVVLDHLGLPYPGERDPAGDAPVASSVFAAFLAAHAVTLTPLARCYLAGMGDAGPGERTLRARHTAGMLAVLRDDLGDDAEPTPPHPHDAPLGRELPLLPDPGYPAPGYAALVDIDALERYFATEHRNPHTT